MPDTTASPAAIDAANQPNPYDASNNTALPTVPSAPPNAFGMFGPPSDPNAIGLLGIPMGTAYGLGNLGANMVAAANQRLPSGHLANPNFLGAFGVELQQTEAQGRASGINQANLAETQARTLGEQAKAQVDLMNAQIMRNRLQYWETHPPGSQTTGDAGGGTQTAANGTPVPDAMEVDPDFRTAMIGLESSGKVNAVNAKGYIGQYQFGAPALYTEGMYKSAPGEALDQNQWQGQITIPGYAPMSKDEFLNNKAAQDEAFSRHMSYLQQQTQAMGLDKYVGKTLANGMVVTPEALAAIEHFGGLAGAKRYLEAGGGNDANGKPTDVTDGNISLSQYATRIGRSMTALRQSSGGSAAQAATPPPDGTTPATTAAAGAPAQPASEPGLSYQPTAGAPAGSSTATNGSIGGSGVDTAQLDRERQAYAQPNPNPGQQAASNLPASPVVRAPSRMTTYDVPESQPGAFSSGQGTPEATLAQNRSPQIAPTAQARVTPTQGTVATPAVPSVVNPPTATALVPGTGSTLPMTAGQQQRSQAATPNDAYVQAMRAGMARGAAGGLDGSSTASTGQLAENTIPPPGATATSPPPSNAPAPASQSGNWFMSPKYPGRAAPAQQQAAQQSGPNQAQQSAEQKVAQYRSEQMGLYQQLMANANRVQQQQLSEQAQYGMVITPGSPDEMRRQATAAFENAQKPPIDVGRDAVPRLLGTPLQDRQTQELMTVAINTAAKQQDNDVTTLKGLQAQGEKDRDGQIAVIQLKHLLGNISTGAGTTTITALKNWASTYSYGPVADAIGKINAADPYEFAKQALQVVGETLDEVGGHNRGIQMLRVFQSASPGLDLPTAANAHLINYLSVLKQENLDKINGATSNYGRALQNFNDDIQARSQMPVEEQQKRGLPRYDNVESYTGRFNQVYKPTLYNAAVLAMDGVPFSVWSKYATSPDDQQRVAGIISRIDPTSKIDINYTDPASGKVMPVPVGGITSTIRPETDIAVTSQQRRQ